jgi:type II secretory ATPase GspE/PulE/Tfp pilus assembly ATPase PilB-like protein
MIAPAVAAASRSRIAPFPVDLATPPAEAFAMYRAWCLAYMDNPTLDDMWVPVGKVGPMVILGHHDPENAPDPSFPLWAFGLARIPAETHARLAIAVADRLSTDEENVYDFGALDLDEPKLTFDLAGARRAAEMLAQFPGNATEATTVTTLLKGSGSANMKTFLDALPQGWREAVLALVGDQPVLDLGPFIPSDEVAALIPESFAREHDLTPVCVLDDQIFTACPVSGRTQQANSILSAWKATRSGPTAGSRLVLILTGASTRAAITARVAKKAAGPATVAREITQSGASVQARMVMTRKEFAGVGLDSPQIDDRTLLRLACQRAIEEGASDLHIDESEGSGQMRIRQDGRMRYLGSGRFAISRLGALIQLLRINIEATGGDLDPADGKFSIRSDEKYFDIRVSILPAADAAFSRNGYAVLRFLPKDGGVRGLSELMLDREEMATLQATMKKPDGIVLVTGPTGSGKTTTLNAMLKHLATGSNGSDPEPRKILTIEDPVEYKMAGVQQISVSKQVGFASAIRMFLRHDPDVVLVGEIRDQETAKAAIVAAKTGHLVFSTLHTNGAVETIARLRGIGIPAYDLDGALLTLIAQRLVPRLCNHCKTQRAVTPGEAALYADAELPVPSTLYDARPEGCPSCRKGIRGQVPILEIVKCTRVLRRAIARSASEDELQQICSDMGCKTLAEQAMLKAASGHISIEDATGLSSGWD